MNWQIIGLDILVVTAILVFLIHPKLRRGLWGAITGKKNKKD